MVAGLVVEAGKHPNADRLQLTRVDVGEPEPRQIVCGAWNFGAGDTVAVVLPGAVLPGGHEITRSTLRGETSDGMILSERELELSDEHTGIMVLGDGYTPGERLVDRLPLRDEVIELEISSNRPDLLGIRGVARDLAAACGLRLAELDDSEPRGSRRRLARGLDPRRERRLPPCARASRRASSATCASSRRRSGCGRA